MILDTLVHTANTAGVWEKMEGKKLTSLGDTHFNSLYAYSHTLTQACIGVSHSCILTTIFNIYSSGGTYLNILSIVKNKKTKPFCMTGLTSPVELVLVLTG